MRPVNRWLTVLSLTAVVITVERVSPTTHVVLGPWDWLRLHEAVQMGIITAFSVIVSFMLLRIVSRNFTLLQDPLGAILAGLFVLGTYFYATGNGVHEVASYLFNQYCDAQHFVSAVCRSTYADNYYVGNIVYFFGLGLSDLALILFELRRPDRDMTGRDQRVTLANAAVLALTFIAYDGFDRVAVGLVSTIIFALVFGGLLLRSREPARYLPFTLYSALGFTIAAVIAIPIRLLR